MDFKHSNARGKQQDFSNLEAFEDGFTGMTCDFSDAKRQGLEAALRTHYSVAVDEEVDMSRYY
ncbi:hypothetical protein BGZ67_007674, partial [Mortierella alpina]